MNTNTVLAAVALALASFATGCAGVRTTYQSSEAPSHTSTQSSESIEVLLDAAPSRPFKVVGEIASSSGSSTHSIEAMREAAAAAGLDGIYWIDCTSPCSGRCTAKGFVYTDAQSTRNVAANEVTVASR